LNLPAYTLSGSQALPAYRQPGVALETATMAGHPPAGQAAGLLDLNHATEDELCGLPGIGPALAERIVAYRTQTPFQSVEDLVNVPGIGDKKLEAIRPLATAYP
jgi:competence protein ComEA